MAATIGCDTGARHGVAAAVLLLASLSGCAIRQALVNRMGDALAEGGAVYASDPDVELVGAATPFGLKLLESLNAAAPLHRGLKLALARGFTQYAYAYLELPADVTEASDVTAAYAARGRARRLYLRARDYGLTGLELAHPGLGAQLATDPGRALAVLDRRDVPLAYWTATAWGAAIALGKDEPALLAGLPAVRALAQRGLALEEGFDSGALHVLNLTLEMSEPGSAASRQARAHAHLERALALSGGRQAAPYVAYAESVSVPTGNRAEFDALLATALSLDADASAPDRLANALFQRRARWLSARAGDLFGP